MTSNHSYEMEPDFPLGGEDLLSNDEGYCIGARGQALLRYTSETHFITMASTGFGKGRSVVTPNLLLHPGSVFTTEISGDNVRKTIKYRKHILEQDVYVLDPLEVTQEPKACLNILDTLDPKRTTFVNDVELIARSILQDHKGKESSDPYWTTAPMELLKALIVYVKTALDVRNDQRHLPYIAELLSKVGTKDWGNLLLRLKEDRSEHSTLLNQIGNRYSTENDNTRSVLSVLESYLGFARNSQLAKYMKASDFSLRDLRDKKCTVYLVMPSAEYYKANATWLRLIIERAIASCPDLGDDKVQIPHNERILFMLDEFTQLGKLEAIDQGMQTARHKGITLWCVFQDLNRLRSVYGEEIAESFLGAAGCIQVFGTTDLKTARYISERMGNRVALIPTVSEAVNWNDGTTQNHSETTSAGKNKSWLQGTTKGTNETYSTNVSKGYSHGVTNSFGKTKSSSFTQSQSSSTTQSDSFSDTDTRSSSTSRGRSFSDTDARSSSTSRGRSFSDTDARSSSNTNTKSSSDGKGKSSSSSSGSTDSPSGRSDSNSDTSGESTSRNTGKSTSDMTGQSHSRTDGRSISDTDGRSHSQTVGRSVANTDGRSHSQTVGRSVANTVGQGTASTTGESSTETSGTTETNSVSESEGKAVGTSHSTTEQTSEGINEQYSFQVGWADTKNVGGQYSVTYTPHVLPKLEADQVISLLGDENKELQLIFLRKGARKILDGRANWDQIELLRQRVEGPPLLPPPEHLTPLDKLTKLTWEKEAIEWLPQQLEIPHSPELTIIPERELKRIFDAEFADFNPRITPDRTNLNFNRKELSDRLQKVQNEMLRVLQHSPLTDYLDNYLKHYSFFLEQVKVYETRFFPVGQKLVQYDFLIRQFFTQLQENNSYINPFLPQAKEHIQKMESYQGEFSNYSEWIKAYTFFRRFWKNLESPPDPRSRYEFISPPQPTKIDVNRKLKEVELTSIILPNPPEPDFIQKALNSLPVPLDQDAINHQLSSSLRSNISRTIETLNSAENFLEEKLRQAKQRLHNEMQRINDELESTDLELSNLNRQIYEVDQRYENISQGYQGKLSPKAKGLFWLNPLLFSMLIGVVISLIIGLSLCASNQPDFSLPPFLQIFRVWFLIFAMVGGIIGSIITYIRTEKRVISVIVAIPSGLVSGLLAGGIALVVSSLRLFLDLFHDELPSCIQEAFALEQSFWLPMPSISAFVVSTCLFTSVVVNSFIFRKYIQSLQNSKSSTDQECLLTIRRISDQKTRIKERLQYLEGEKQKLPSCIAEELQRSLISDLKMHILNGFNWTKTWNLEHQKVKKHIELLEKSRKRLAETGNFMDSYKLQLESIADQIDTQWTGLTSIYHAFENERKQLLYEMCSWEVWQELEEQNQEQESSNE